MADETETVEFKHKRIICFDDPAARQAFEAAFSELLQQRHHEAMAAIMPAQNFHRYNHGGDWERPAREDGPETTMKTLSTSWELPYRALIENDLGVIERSAGPITESMGRQFSEMMYETVGHAAEKVGNVVDAKQHTSFAETFFAGLEKVEFGVDRDGKVSLPQIHVGSDMLKRVIADLEAQPAEFRERVERLIQEKSAKALLEENARKARFKRPKT